jgi:hypothetical protein
MPNNQHAGPGGRELRTLFNPDKAFLDLPVVRITFMAILILASASVLAIWKNGDYISDFSSDGFNHAAQIFRVPIGILTLSIPLLALLAANHRSEQTKKQMQLTSSQIARTDKQIVIAQSQNAFSNHFKHVEEFDKLYKLKDGGTHYLTSTKKAHSLLFPASRKGDLSLDKNVLSDISEYAEAFFHVCKRFHNTNEWTDAAYDIDTLMTGLMATYYIAAGRSGSQHLNSKGETFMLVGKNVVNMVMYYIEVFRFIDDVLAFDDTYSPPEPLKRIIDLNLHFFPPVTGNFSKFDIEEIARRSGGYLDQKNDDKSAIPVVAGSSPVSNSKEFI